MDINAKNAHGDNVWTKVEMVIQAYARVHPQEIKDTVSDNARRVAMMKNDFGSGNKLRFGVSIPHGLLFKLQNVEPKLFTDKKLMNEFMKRYKGFRVCQKV